MHLQKAQDMIKIARGHVEKHAKKFGYLVH